MPVTTCAAIRDGSVRTIAPPPAGTRRSRRRRHSVKSADADRDEHVRAQAGRLLVELALEADHPAERRRRRRGGASVPAQLERGDSATRRIDRLLLRLPIRSIPLSASSSSSSSWSRPNGHALRRRLHLDEPAVAGHDDVQVDVGGRVLDVVEVEQELAADDPERDRRDRARHRLREPEPVERPPRRDPGPGDRRAARAAVGLEHVAVEPERPLAERLEVGRPRGRRGRSGAGSRRCAPSASRTRPRAASAAPSTPAAASTRP